VCASTAGLATLFGFAATDLNQLSILKFIPNFMEIKHQFVTESGCVVEIQSSTGIVSCNIKIVQIEVAMDLMQVDMPDFKAVSAPKIKVISPQSEQRLLQPLSPAPIVGENAPVSSELKTTRLSTPGNTDRTRVPSSPNPTKSPSVLLPSANHSSLARVFSSGIWIF
jgi:hypothetical protein